MASYLIEPVWDTDGESVEEIGLPRQIIVADCPDGEKVADRIEDLISDCFGFCHRGFSMKELSPGDFANGVWGTSGINSCGYIVYD